MIEPLIREAFRAGVAWESDSRTQTPQGAVETEDQIAERLRLDLCEVPQRGVLVTRGWDDDVAAKGLADALTAAGRPDVLVICLTDPAVGLDAIDEAAMREYGWVRAPGP